VGRRGNGVLESVVFGFTVSFAALLQGYEAQPTPEGVARPPPARWWSASLTALGLDFVLTAMMFEYCRRPRNATLR